MYFILRMAYFQNLLEKLSSFKCIHFQPYCFRSVTKIFPELNLQSVTEEEEVCYAEMNSTSLICSEIAGM